MTDTTNFFRSTLTTVNNFIQAYEAMALVSDRISADSGLSAATAATAQALGRTDLTTADFDNLNATIKAITALLNAAGNGTVNPNVNSATVKLPLYKII